MKIESIILASFILVAPISTSADESSGNISEEQYQAAIASFGLNQQEAEAASKEAVRKIEQQHLTDMVDKSHPVADLPSDWLESSPY